MVTTNNPEFARTIRILRDWGAERKYQHVMKGFNYRMEGIQGAILRIKLRYLERWTEARRSHAATYRELLRESGIVLPQEVAGNRHVYHIFAVLSFEREELMRALQERGVQTGIHYPTPVHLLPAYSDLPYQAGDFPVSERIAAQEVSLPMFPELSRSQIHQVSEALMEHRRVCYC